MKGFFYIFIILFSYLELAAGEIIHTVLPGETLYRISKTYGITVEELKRANNLTTNIIKVGERLIIPTQQKESPNNKNNNINKTQSVLPKEEFLFNIKTIKKESDITTIKKEKLKKQITVVIDAGHGGKDPGAVRYYGEYLIREKDINLDIAKRLKGFIEYYMKNAYVYLTREEDIFLPLYQRTKFANSAKADIFISIHSNAAISNRAHGFEVYHLAMEATDLEARKLACIENKVVEVYEDKETSELAYILADLAQHKSIEESIELAHYINNAVIQEENIVSNNRGVKGAFFYVLKGALMPAVLIETGFISNYEEVQKLLSEEYRNNLAMAICKGLQSYFYAKDKLVGSYLLR